MKPHTIASNFVLRISLATTLASLCILPMAHAALVNTTIQSTDLTLSGSNYTAEAGSNVGYNFTSTDGNAHYNSANANFTDFTAGVDFTLSATWTFDATNSSSSTGGTTNDVSYMGLTLFGSEVAIDGGSSGIFGTLNLYEERPGYDGNRRLSLGTNAPNNGSYIGNLPGNGDATSGGTYYPGATTSTGSDGTQLFFSVDISYDSATQVDAVWTVTDGGLNTQTLTINDIDISGISTNTIFGMNSVADNSIANGTWSELYLTQVPEPSAFAFIAGVFSLVSIMLRRRR